MENTRLKIQGQLIFAVPQQADNKIEKHYF
jgi:hypothetical protein